MADQQLNYALKGDSSGATAAFKDVAAAIQRAEDKADKFTASVDKLKESTSRQIANMSRHSAEIERQVAGMGRQGAETERLIGSTTRLGGAMASFAGNLAAIGAANVLSGVVNAAGAALEYGAAIQDLSDRTKISTGDLQIFGAWAEMSGTSTEALAKGVAKLEANLAGGGKELREFNIDATNGRDALLQVIRAVENAETDLQKVTIANAAFGRSWSDLMPILDAGADNLQEIADNTSLIDEKSIQNLAQLDDRMVQLLATTRSFAAEFMAAFGPAMSQILEGMAVEVRNLKEAWTTEDRDDFLSRIGAKKVGGSFVVDSKIDPSKLATKDLYRLMEVKSEKSDDVIFSEQDDRFRRMHSVYLAKIRADEKANNEKIAKDKEAKLAEQRRLESLDNADKLQKRLEAEGKFQTQMARETEMLRATEDAKEILRIEQKYSALIEAHRGYSDSILAIEKAREAELQNYYMQQNFKRAGQERDADEKSQKPKSDGSIEYQYSKFFQSQKVGLPDIEEVNASAPPEMKKRWEDEETPIEKRRQEFQAFLIESKREMDSFVDGLSEKFSGTLGPAIIDAFTSPMDAIETLKNAALSVIESIAGEVSALTVRWMILNAAASAFGSSNPISLGKFLFTGFSGHAEGTLSSPGGIKYLGERGPEPYETPYGQRGIATFGLYQVPAGTRVQSASGSAFGGTKEFHLHTTESDPIQVGEIFRRIVREEIALDKQAEYRERLS